MPTSLPFSFDNPASVTAFREGLGPRRFRLFLSGCCRGFFPPPLAPAVADAFERCDRFGDTGKSKSALREAKTLIQYAPRIPWTKGLAQGAFGRYAEPFALLNLVLGEDLPDQPVWLMRLGLQYTLELSVVAADEYLLRVLNEMSGPDDRPPFDADWRTADVVGLARGIYKELAFDRMPILSDALMDAGCEDKAIISHCRGTDPHLRGCWVLDAILDGQWESAWQESKAAKTPKGPRSPFKLDRVSKAEFDRELQSAAKLPLEEGLTADYLNRFTDRKVYLEYVPKTDAGTISRLKQERGSYRLLARGSGSWTVPGVVRRITNNDPGELARYGAMTARVTWILEGRSQGYRVPWELSDAILFALAVRDELALRRLVETSPFPWPSSQYGSQLYYHLVVAAARGDWAYVRQQASAIESGIELRERFRANGLCIAAIADGSADLVATQVAEAVVAHRRWSGHRVLKHVALEVHGLYELARRKSPELVAKFDVNHPVPWDAEYHAWLQANTRPLPDIDWEKFPAEIRAGLRDLPRPAWWDVLPDD